MNWMAWTELTATFFSVIAVILIFMTVYEIKVPCIDRKGFLPISTTRGDRLFIGLLSGAYIHLGFIAFSELSLIIALTLSIVWLALLLRWG
jgi:predicted small integral membrane protein